MTRTARSYAHRALGLVLALFLSLAALAGCSAPAAETDRGSAGSNASANAGGTAPDEKKVKIEEGAEAPDFEFATMDGQTAKLSDYQGEVVVLTFWATWCGYCMRDMPELDKIDQNFDDVQIVAINRGDRSADAQAKAEELGYGFAWGLDEDGAIEALYPASGIPYTVIIDKDGVVSTVFAGSAQDMYSYLEMAVTKAGA